MKFQSSITHKIAVFTLIGLLSVSESLILNPSVFADTKKDQQLVGQLSLTGLVTVNEKKAINGTAVFSDARLKVACAVGNRATVNLGRLGRIEMTPGSQMVLKFSDGVISGELVMGKIVVSSTPGVKVAINTPEGISASDGKGSSVLAVATQRGVRCVPVMATQSASATALGSGALAAILLGAGGTAVAGAVVSSQAQASNPNP
ncbi:MAG TPA: hypothetical protein PLK30_14765 [Blastocatellia bacterium]|nr:hypothetical protein [Blastocatellia bacterium]